MSWTISFHESAKSVRRSRHYSAPPARPEAMPMATARALDSRRQHAAGGEYLGAVEAPVVPHREDPFARHRQVVVVALLELRIDVRALRRDPEVRQEGAPVRGVRVEEIVV